jgi:SAM-dependent methyltransferase
MTTGEAFGELWSHGARDWANFVEPQYQSLYETLHDRLSIGNGVRLLDVGCGPGGAALLAARRGARVAGLDASPDSVEVARERVPEGDFRVADMESLPWPDHSFGAVTGFNSFPFAGDPRAALAEVHRVLAPRGNLGMVIFSRPEESQQTRIMAAIGALAPAQSAGGPGPFALSAFGAAEPVLEAVGLLPVDRGQISIVLEYPTAEAACRAFMAGGGSARAVHHSGQERVRQAIQETLEEFRSVTGEYRIKNCFQFLIATKPSTI